MLSRYSQNPLFTQTQSHQSPSSPYPSPSKQQLSSDSAVYPQNSAADLFCLSAISAPAGSRQCKTPDSSNQKSLILVRTSYSHIANLKSFY